MNRHAEDLTQGDLTPISLRWLKVTAGLATLLGIAGLVALSQESWAANGDTPGFDSGSKTFNNPFAGGATPPPQPTATGRGNSYFPDEDEDEFRDYDDSGFEPPTGRFTGSNPAGAHPAPGAGQPPGQGAPSGGISMGGTPTGIVSNNQTPAIKIDDETGLGPGAKEIVTDFNFPDADILDIAKTLGKLTGKNFILDKDVKGRITIISNSAITVADAWKAFLTALDMSGFGLIPSGKYVRIARNRDARDKQLKTYTGDYSPDTDALITRVFSLKYIDAEQVTRVLRSFMPASSRIIPHDQTNTVIVTDTGSNIAKINRMLGILDIEGYDAGIEVIPVKFASAAELSKLIDTLIPGTNAGTGQPPGRPTFGGGGSRFTARRTKEGGIINTIIADERTNNLIVHANTRGADQVRELVTKLDQKLPAQVGGGRVHVVYLQFAEAEQIANTLNNLSQTAGGGRPMMPGGPAGGTGINPVATTLFEGAIKVSPDKSTNSLVITGSPGDFVTVQRVINKLDIPRDEVYVEVVIMEMLLSREFQFSANVISPKSGIGSLPNSDLAKFIQNPLSQNGLVLGFKQGQSFNMDFGTGKTFTVSSVTGLIKAIQTNNVGNVLATPQILTLDNTEATFESAEKIPVPTVTAIQGSTSTGVTKEPVALSIKIKPQINKLSNFVKLDVTTKLADISNRAVPSQLEGLAFATTERNAQTSVVVADSDTVVIGGLVRDKMADSVSKVPILGDIPLLGWLFRAKSSASEKMNLLMFMTPHIVRQYDKVRALLDRKLKERDDFIEKNAGGIDPQREYRDDLIRSLPDVKDITSYKPKTTETIEGEGQSPAESNSDNPFTGGGAPQKAPPAGGADSSLFPEQPATVHPEAGEKSKS